MKPLWNILEPGVSAILQWFVFVAILPLLPLAFIYTERCFHKVPTGIEDLLGGGELLLICSSLCAAGLAEIFSCQKFPRWLRIPIGGCSCITSVYSAWCFQAVVVDKQLHRAYDAAAVTHASLWVFACTMVVTLVSLGVSKYA